MILPILIAIFFLCLIMGVIIKMAITGQTKKKGAKKIRKKVLPMFYGKGSIFKKIEKL